MDAPRRDRADRPRLPWLLVAVTTAIAVLSTSGFLYLLSKRTVGPGRVLADFYLAVNAGDCDRSYRLLDEELRSRTDRGAWCGEAARLHLPASFRTESITLEGDQAVITVGEPGGRERVWRLSRAGDSWRVARLPSPL